MTGVPSTQQFADQYNKLLSIRGVAAAHGLKFCQARKLFLAGINEGKIIRPRHAQVKYGGEPTHVERKAALQEVATPPIAGRVQARVTPEAKRKTGITRFLLTCAQNNTEVHEKLWENLKAMANHYNAEIFIARTVYNKFATASDMDKKLIIGSHPTSKQKRDYHWDDRLTPYFYDDRLELAPGLVWCGETNIMPTAANPLTGFENYTGRASAIVPHPRIAMRSVSTHPSEGTKLLYTTGTLTLRNYIQRKAGQMAEFHHCYGALLVEVDAEGNWFCRQVNGDSDGVIHDWDVRVADGVVTTGNHIEAITWGDIHVAYGDPMAYNLAWGKGGILDQLQPKYQFLHDLIDFRARNPHNIKRGLHLQAFVEHTLGHRSVNKEMHQTADFLQRTLRSFCETLVVDSNHDNFLVEWLAKTGDFRKDPTNAVYFLKAAHWLWSQTELFSKPPNMTYWAMKNAILSISPTLKKSWPLRFLNEDESFIICPEAGGGIECGLHGHEKFNGARGGPRAFSKMGRKVNAGHVHSTGIWDGAYFSGIMGSLDQGYNDGLGSWSQSNILTYPNGKRAIQTIYKGKARA